MLTVGLSQNALKTENQLMLERIRGFFTRMRYTTFNIWH